MNMRRVKAVVIVLAVLVVTCFIAANVLYGGACSAKHGGFGDFGKGSRGGFHGEPPGKGRGGMGFSEHLNAKIAYMLLILIVALAAIMLLPKYVEYVWIAVLTASVIVLGFLLRGVSPLSELTGFINSVSRGGFGKGAALVMLVALGSTLLVGRIVCGWICPAGALQSLIAATNRWRRVKMPGKLDKHLKKMKYIVLLLVLATVLTTGGSYANMGEIFNSVFKFEASAYLAIGLAFLAASFFIERAWCRYFCPLGALLSLLQKISIFKIKTADGNRCVNCNMCLRDCPMQCAQIGDGDCIMCGRCISNCPRNLVRMKPGPLS